MTTRKLSADSVCAFTWEHASEQFRASLCALASVPHSLTLLDWYEIGDAERAKLRPELADVIETNATRQRAEWAKGQGVAA